MSLADNATWNAVKPFLNGGLSGMGATCIIQPLDIVKVRPSAIPPRRLAAPIRSRGVRRLGRARGLGPARAPRGLAPGVRPATESAPPNAAALPPRRGTSSPPIPPNRQPTKPRPPASFLSPLSEPSAASPPVFPSQVRLQLGSTGGPFAVAGGIIKNEGFGALYTVRARASDDPTTHTPPARRVGPVLPGRNEASAEARTGNQSQILGHARAARTLCFPFSIITPIN